MCFKTFFRFFLKGRISSSENGNDPVSFGLNNNRYRPVFMPDRPFEGIERAFSEGKHLELKAPLVQVQGVLSVFEQKNGARRGT